MSQPGKFGWSQVVHLDALDNHVDYPGFGFCREIAFWSLLSSMSGPMSLIPQDRLSIMFQDGKEATFCQVFHVSFVPLVMQWSPICHAAQFGSECLCDWLQRLRPQSSLPRLSSMPILVHASEIWEADAFPSWRASADLGGTSFHGR